MAGKAQLVPAGAAGADQIFAVTDLIGRPAGGGPGVRAACAGWIFGDSARCAYVAMCSLFLPREKVLYWNCYGEDGNWKIYSTETASSALPQQHYVTRQFAGRNASEASWQAEISGGLSADVLVMNTRGLATFFDMSRGRCHPTDVAVLNEPAALHLIHSWSLQQPENDATVGGRWLSRGVYAYVGSVDEPFLDAFIPPMLLAQRWVNFVPFLIAGRWWPDDQRPPGRDPWKVNTLGDPLMLCAPPEKVKRQRIAPQPMDGVDLSEHVKVLLRRSKDEPSTEVFADAVGALVLLGKDDVAVDVWRLARSKSQSRLASRSALGALFRMRAADEFVQAFAESGTRDLQAIDMLWHLLLPRLGSSKDEEALVQLQSALREPYAWVDLTRLAPHLSRVFGQGHVRSVIQRELERTKDATTREKLSALLKQQ
jgi:hypothetical protein